MNDLRRYGLGDRVMRRVGGDQYGDVIGLPWSDYLGEVGDGKILVGWADGSQTWEQPIELRFASEK